MTTTSSSSSSIENTWQIPSDSNHPPLHERSGFGLIASKPYRGKIMVSRIILDNIEPTIFEDTILFYCTQQINTNTLEPIDQTLDWWQILPNTEGISNINDTIISWLPWPDVS